MSEHYRKLERLFHSAPIQDMLKGASIQVAEGTAEYTLPITEEYFHAAEAMHGAIYFKLLDDAAYFAAASLEEESFLLTKTYEIRFRRPVGVGQLRAVGTALSVGEKEIVAESKIYNSEDKVVAQGEGVFVNGPKRLVDLPGYSG